MRRGLVPGTVLLKSVDGQKRRRNALKPLRARRVREAIGRRGAAAETKKNRKADRFAVRFGARRETRTLTLIRRRILSPLRLPFRHPGVPNFCTRNLRSPGPEVENSGVGDGTRTHDNRNHNPGLYQLSYTHHQIFPRFAWPARQDSNQRPSA